MAETLFRMTMRAVWALCLAMAAMISGIGIELAFAGEDPLTSYPLVAGGIVFLPIASMAIERAKRRA